MPGLRKKGCGKAMGREIAVLLGSPHKNGNSAQMAEALIEGLKKAGDHAVKIYAEDLQTGCCDCGGCYRAEGRPCAQHPDFNEVAPALLRADGIVFALPLYWFDFPGKLKCLIDNMYCFYATGKDIARKRAAILCCAHGDEYSLFDGVQRTYELIVQHMNWSSAAQIYIGGVEGHDGIRDTDALQRCRALGERIFR